MGVTQTPDGYLWIGTLMGGVSRFDGLRFVNFDLEETKGQGPTQVNHLFTDAAGRLWVNTFFGLWRYDAGALCLRIAEGNEPGIKAQQSGLFNPE